MSLLDKMSSDRKKGLQDADAAAGAGQLRPLPNFQPDWIGNYFQPSNIRFDSIYIWLTDNVQVSM